MTPSGDALERLIMRAREDPDVLAVLLFGSRARATATPVSDYDVCLVLAAPRASPVDASEKRLQYLALGELAVVVFQRLPLYMRSRVLQEGRVLFTRDEGVLYDVALRTAKAFEGFRHIHRADLDAVARG
jgi:predicted nucleotidyltransferase